MGPEEGAAVVVGAVVGARVGARVGAAVGAVVGAAVGAVVDELAQVPVDEQVMPFPQDDPAFLFK